MGTIELSSPVMIALTLVWGVFVVWAVGFEIKINGLYKALAAGRWVTPKHRKRAQKRAIFWFIPAKWYFAKQLKMEKARTPPVDHGD